MASEREAHIERMCRATQAVSRPDVNPDQLTPAPRGTVGLIPVWRLYEHMATAALDAIEAAIRADQVERDAKVADSIARAAANEVHSYDSYGGPSLPGRDREVTRQQVADEISAAIRQKGSDHAG